MSGYQITGYYIEFYENNELYQNIISEQCQSAPKPKSDFRSICL